MRCLLIIFIAITLQSCFVASIGSSPRWNCEYKNESENVISKQASDTARPDVDVTVNLNSRFIIVPFFFLDIDRKLYDVHFGLRTKNDDYTVLDSVTYLIQNNSGNVLNRGKAFHEQGVSISKKQESNFYYQAWVDTGYLVELDKRKKEDLTIHFVLFMKKNGEAVAEEYSCPLNVKIPKRIHIQPFEI